MRTPMIFPLLLGTGLLFVNASSCSNDTTVKHNDVTQVEEEEQTPNEIGDISGPLVIEGSFRQIGPLEGQTIILYETEGKDRFVLDSAKIENGSYRFDLQEVKIGFYRMGTSSLESAIGTYILNPNEKHISIDHRTPNFMNSMTFENSEENTAFKRYQAQKRKYDKDITALRRSREQSSVKLKKIFARDAAFDAVQDSMALAHPMTFFAKTTSRLQSPNRFDRNSYWNDIDFQDASIIRSTVLNDRIQDYMRNHASKENTKEDRFKGFYNGVDRIANLVKDKGSDRVLEFMLYTISEGFYTSNMEEISHYVIDNYFYGDGCGDSEISELFKMKAAGIRKLQVGNTPPEFTLPMPDGSVISMSEVVEKNDHTLILFWASFCHKCEEELPVINSIYRANKTKGFEIISVSVDVDRNSWLSGIEKKDAPGYNCSDLLGWAGPVTKDFRVTSTPVMFLVNKEGQLVSKPKSAAELGAYLNAH